MELKFSKYHGTGNDFIIINNMQGEIVLDTSQVQHLCDRHFGVGSDGLILIEKSKTADFNMNFYNPDGSQSFCGNGSRCTVHFANAHGIVSDNCTFEAIDGIHQASISNDSIRIGMLDVLKFEVTTEYYYINTGSPHHIQYISNLKDLSIIEEAHKVRYNDRFAEKGTNVNFVEEINSNTVRMRTYERGVEDETLSCGTGVTAVALSFALRNPELETIHVEAPGGKLEVNLNYQKNQFTNIWLSGPAKLVFNGLITL